MGQGRRQGASLGPDVGRGRTGRHPRPGPRPWPAAVDSDRIGRVATGRGCPANVLRSSALERDAVVDAVSVISVRAAVEGLVESFDGVLGAVTAGGVGAVVLAVVRVEPCDLVVGERSVALVEAGRSVVPLGRRRGVGGAEAEVEHGDRELAGLAAAGVEVSGDGAARLGELIGPAGAFGLLEVEVAGPCAELVEFEREGCGPAFTVGDRAAEVVTVWRAWAISSACPRRCSGRSYSSRAALASARRRRSAASSVARCWWAETVCSMRRAVSARWWSWRLMARVIWCSVSSSHRICSPGSGSAARGTSGRSRADGRTARRTVAGVSIQS